MADEVLRVQDDGRVRTLTIDRPAALNALNRDVLWRLSSEIETVRKDQSIGCLVIQGGGDRAFCAGADLHELVGLDGSSARDFLDVGRSLFDEISSMPIPVIAAVRGFALGGGLELALACSVVIAADDAKLGLPESRLGAMPGYGGTQRLPRAIGEKPAMHMVLTGRSIDAARAWHLGLLSTPPVAPADLDDEVQGLAHDLAGLSRDTSSMILEAMRAASPQASEVRHSVTLAAMAIGSDHGQEGISAFLDKRRPVFLTPMTSKTPPQ